MKQGIHLIALGLFLVACSGARPAPESADRATPPPTTGQPTAQNPKKAATVVLVRHAEKAIKRGDPNPPLRKAGVIRADCLAQLLQNAPVDAVYATKKLRTRQTAKPLAASHGQSLLGLDIPMNASQGGIRLLQKALLGQIDRNRGGFYVVVNHSPNLVGILGALGVHNRVLLDEVSKAMDKGEYDNVLIVTWDSDGKARCRKQSYQDCPFCKPFEGKPESGAEDPCQQIVPAP